MECSVDDEVVRNAKRLYLYGSQVVMRYLLFHVIFRLVGGRGK